MRDEILPTRRLGAFCQNARRTLVSHIDEVLQGRPAINVGYSAHPNVGDTLISIAEDALVRASTTKHYLRICHDTRVRALEHGQLPRAWRSAAQSGLLLHGGGNLGDIYPSELENRLDAIEANPDVPVLQLPQSIYFSDLRNAERFRRVTGMHRYFRLLVRDRSSMEWAEKHLDCDTQLAPDSALSLKPRRRHGTPEVPVLVFARIDQEASETRTLPDGVETVDWFPEPRVRQDLRMAPRWFGDRKNLSVGLRNWIVPLSAHGRVARGRRLLARGSVVIADRLHAVILAQINGIPVVAVDNSYGKVHGVVTTWGLQTLGGVSLADTYQSALELAQRLG